MLLRKLFCTLFLCSFLFSVYATGETSEDSFSFSLYSSDNGMDPDPVDPGALPIEDALLFSLVTGMCYGVIRLAKMRNKIQNKSY